MLLLYKFVVIKKCWRGRVEEQLDFCSLSCSVIPPPSPTLIVPSPCLSLSSPYLALVLFISLQAVSWNYKQCFVLMKKKSYIIKAESAYNEVAQGHLRLEKSLSHSHGAPFLGFKMVCRPSPIFLWPKVLQII